MKHYDVFIIGSGMAGVNIANRCASKGLSVGVTDELPYGGTCALRGCDPKKILLSATEVSHLSQNLNNKNISSIPRISWKNAMQLKHEFVNQMPVKIEKGYRKNNIDTFHDSAKFLSPNQLKVGEETIEANKIVIATGSKPKQLNIPGSDFALTSTDFLNFIDLPNSLLFIGGGYIAFEFAHMAARYGCQVTIVHRGPRPLKNFEEFIVEKLVKATKELNIELILDTNVTEIEKTKKGFKVTGQNKHESKYWVVDKVINSAGRTPAIFDLDIEKANIKLSKQGILVNDYLQSISNTNIYAAGDVADTKGLPLTPVAVMEGHIVASNILNENKKQADYNAIPTVVFTLPTMASVGLTEEEANSKGYQYKVKQNTVSDWFTAKRLNEKTYAFKTIIDKKNDTILGAHIIGPHAEEVINLFAMAMNTQLKSIDIKTMLFSYPSASSDMVYMV